VPNQRVKQTFSAAGASANAAYPYTLCRRSFYMKRVTLFLSALLLTAMLRAAEYSRAFEIIQKEGQFVFMDGSSYYRLWANGTFDSGPVSISGRTISGKWKTDGDYRFIIEGEWGWMNGINKANDNRTLVLAIEPPFALQPQSAKPPTMFIPSSKDPPRIYKCYFIIDELKKRPF
jgi:hypothetical protein